MKLSSVGLVLVVSVSSVACEFDRPPPIEDDARTHDARGIDASPIDAAAADAWTVSYPEPAAYWALDDADITGSLLVARLGDFDGNIQGAALVADAVAGEALLFANGEDAVGFGDVLDNVLSGADNRLSVSLWVKPTSVSGLQLLFVKLTLDNCDSQNTYQLAISVNAGRPQLGYYTPGGQSARVLRSTAAIAAGAWRHLVFTYDGAVDSAATDRIRVYVDGVPQGLEAFDTVGAFPFDIQDTAAHLALGGSVSSTGTFCAASPFDGAVDEVAVWDAVLTAEQADELRARGAAGRGLWP